MGSEEATVRHGGEVDAHSGRCGDSQAHLAPEDTEAHTEATVNAGSAQTLGTQERFLQAARSPPGAGGSTGRRGWRAVGRRQSTR